MPLRTATSAMPDGETLDPSVVTRPRSVLLVDSDRLHVARLKRLFEERHYHVQVVETVSEASRELLTRAPDCAVIEIHLPDGSGLDVLASLNRVRPGARAVVLTNYGNIASAVAAIKRGAVDYLAKPGDFEEIHALLCGATLDRPLPDSKPMSADRVRWEHIQRIYEQCGHNVSETARRLNMHRRTLQRILAKRAPR